MDSREQFEKFWDKHSERTYEIYYDSGLYRSAEYTWKKCQALNDARRAKQKEYYEMVMQDGGKRIAQLEAKLKVAREALKYYSDTDHYNYSQDGHIELFDYGCVAEAALKTLGEK